MRGFAVWLAWRLLVWVAKKPYFIPDPLDVWFEWRFIYHNRVQPTELDWVRLWSVWKRPVEPKREFPWLGKK